MNLTLHTFGNTRVLKCTDQGVRWSAQENIDQAKFDAALADENNTVVNYEDTQAHQDSVAAGVRSDKLAQIKELEEQAVRSHIAYTLDPSNNAEKGFLKAKHDAIKAIRDGL
jgi:hypothetical protein